MSDEQSRDEGLTEVTEVLPSACSSFGASKFRRSSRGGTIGVGREQNDAGSIAGNKEGPCLDCRMAASLKSFDIDGPRQPGPSISVIARGPFMTLTRKNRSRSSQLPRVS